MFGLSATLGDRALVHDDCEVSGQFQFNCRPVRIARFGACSKSAATIGHGSKLPIHLRRQARGQFGPLRPAVTTGLYSRVMAGPSVIRDCARAACRGDRCELRADANPRAVNYFVSGRVSWVPPGAQRWWS
jgi:hypothetical protein